MNNEKGLKSIFAKKEAQDIRSSDSDDYTVVKNGRIDMVLRILSLLCALGIWVAIVITDSATMQFNNFSVTVKGSSDLHSSYTIDYDFTKVNFSIQGKGSQISQISESDIQVYVDLSSVPASISASAETQTVDLPLIYEIKTKASGIQFVQKSRESIRVTFTKKTS